MMLTKLVARMLIFVGAHVAFLALVMQAYAG
jgi:hypothetical protein